MNADLPGWVQDAVADGDMEQVGWMAPECYDHPQFFTRHKPENPACGLHGHPWRPLFVVSDNGEPGAPS